MIGAKALLAWSLKPAIGFFQDSFPIAGKRRTPYIVGCSLSVAAICWYYGTKPNFDKNDLGDLIFYMSTFTAIGDVATDGMIGNKSSGKNIASSSLVQTIVWTSSFSMRLVFSFGWVYLDSFFGGFQSMYVCLAAPINLAVAVLILTVEEPTAPGASPRASYKVLKETVSTIFEYRMRTMLGFMFLYIATPSIDMNLYYRFEHGFSNEFLTNLSGYATLATIGAGLATQCYIHVKKYIPYRSLIGWSTLLEASLGLMPMVITTGFYKILNIGPEMMTLGGSLLNSSVDNFQRVNTFAVLSNFCGQDSAGMTFATMMAIINAGNLVKAEFDVMVMKNYNITCTYDDGNPECNWENLSDAILFCQLTSFGVLFLFVWSLPAMIKGAEEPENTKELEEEEGQEQREGQGQREGEYKREGEDEKEGENKKEGERKNEECGSDDIIITINDKDKVEVEANLEIEIEMVTMENSLV